MIYWLFDFILVEDKLSREKINQNEENKHFLSLKHNKYLLQNNQFSKNLLTNLKSL